MSDVTLSIEDGVARLAIARPEIRNALREATCRGLADGLAEAARDESVRALVLTGEGGTFCAGADLSDPSAFQTPDPAAEFRRHLDEVFHPVVRGVRAFPRPVIAVVEGAAVGFGFDLALACDLRICTEDAKLGPTFLRLGLVPDGGGPHTLQRHIGPARTMEWILRGSTMRGAEVRDWGLFNRVVAADAISKTTAELLAPIVAGPPRAIAAARALIYGAQERSYDAELDAERDIQVELLQSRDFMEGVSAFMERRPPRFTGK